jgi:hypothetical protein
MEVDPNPDGSMKQLRASVETRDAEGSSSETVVYYNGPLSSGLGSDLMLLVRPHSVPTLRLARGEDRSATRGSSFSICTRRCKPVRAPSPSCACSTPTELTPKC